MKKTQVLVWGRGNTWKQNRVWINQLYDVVGITGADVEEKDENVQEKVYAPENALTLKWEYIIVVSGYFEDIRRHICMDCKIDVNNIKNFEDEFKHQHRVSFGNKNEQVTFYILRAHWSERMNGLFNFFDRAVEAYYYAQKKGYELLIDMKNYYTEYAGDSYGMGTNIWENYFLQPSKYALQEAYESKNVILSSESDSEVYYEGQQFSNELYCSRKWNIETFSAFANNCKGWTCLNPKMEQLLECELKKFEGKGKVLGVLTRGTDMVYLKPKNHFVPCNREEFIVLVEQHMKQGGYKYLYLATEDQDILNSFIQRFGNQVIMTDQWRTTQQEEKVLMAVKSGRENDGYLRGQEYCLVIAMLAKCDALVANCICGGGLGAILMNEGAYKTIDVADNGVYK